MTCLWKESTMKRPLMCCVLTAIILALALPAAGGESTESVSLSDAIYKGQPLFSLRYRFEEVDQADIDKKAHASTLRTTVGYRTGTHKGFSFMIEAEDVIGRRRFASVPQWGI